MNAYQMFPKSKVSTPLSTRCPNVDNVWTTLDIVGERKIFVDNVGQRVDNLWTTLDSVKTEYFVDNVWTTLDNVWTT